MTEPTSAQELFKGRHFDREIIVLCVRADNHPGAYFWRLTNGKVAKTFHVEDTKWWLLASYGSADFVAFKAAWSLASSSCESEVVKILPPRPFSSSNTRSLSEVGLLVRTKSADLLGISTVANSFMKRSVIPTSASAPEAAPTVAFRKITLASDPQKPWKAAPSANKLPARCSLTLPVSSFTATATSARSRRPSL